MSSSIAMIVAGAILIAVGGVIATLGWNRRAEDKRRQGLIEQVGAELMINEGVLHDHKFVETDPSKLQQFTVFPRFQTIAIDAAIASGLFLREADRELLTRLSGLSEMFRDFNNRLGLMEVQTLHASTEDKIVWRQKLREGAVRKQMGQKIQSLDKLLMKKYGIDENRRFFIELTEDGSGVTP